MSPKFVGTIVALSANTVTSLVKPVPAIGLRYSHILRCIGQSLESGELKAFELKCQGHTYLVQGWYRSASSSADVECRYTLEDIRKLDDEGKKRRQHRPGVPNLLSLSQVLRLAGNYVDRVCGRLLRVSWQNQSEKIQSVTIQYEPHPDEGKDVPEGQVATIDEVCIHLYKQRKRIAGITDKHGFRSSSI